ncbi:M28 family metallopeptidase [Candidatus Caldatribacterium sp. SIUC1]|uniref:M28 family metallopeptidase n=1 Tax=Candidatus Caldatribacterium sp. SIUC1 TaxID=3418365 RepID=UPI003F68CC8B
MSRESLLDHVLARVQSFGPRPSASHREREFLLFVQETLNRLGLQTARESFRAPATYTWAHLVFWLGLAQAGLVLPRVPLLSAISSLVLLVLEYFELSTFPLVSRLFCFHTSGNVLGKNGEDPEVVFIAHADSATTSIFFHPRFVTSPRISLLLLITASLAITGVSVLAVFFPLELWFWIALPFALYLLFLAFGHFHREVAMPPSPGANDNGSGVAVVLELSRILKERGIPFWAVITGAEESGNWGALHLIAKHGPKLRGKPIVNLDNLGSGTLTLATHEGMWRIYEATPSLVTEFQKLSLPFLAFRPYLGLSTDATPLLARGFPAVTIIALGEQGLPVNWHWHTDTVENLARDNLEKAVQLVLSWIAHRRGLLPEH